MKNEDLKNLGIGIVDNDSGWISSMVNDEDLKNLGIGIVDNDSGWISSMV
jgi:hypothetical protein